MDVATSLVPSGSQVLAASTDIAPNMLFSGAPYPEKLEAYMHAQVGSPGLMHMQLISRVEDRVLADLNRCYPSLKIPQNLC